ncbi:N-acetylmuramoyl-L-alanine amidase [Streptosporangium sp. NPDC001559]|uniref:peptidoglycan recognition protein family protein n=1 Tax=Streptosporangium sp. NPDC001559 TaxID=3366187 RepID=UPI0036F0D689
MHESGGGNLPPRRIVIHATCPGVGYPAASKKGAASGTAKYFQMVSSGGSAHYVYDSSRDEQHCVPDRVIAWHAPPNSRSIGIEICGEATYTRQQWLSPEVWPAVEEAAARTRELCLRFDLPMRKLSVAQVRAGAEGVCGHVDVSAAFRQTDHSDPGPNFPWSEFMGLVNAEKPAPIPVSNPTEATVKKLPTLQLGDGRKDDDPLKWHVKTMHYLLLARDYALDPKVDDTVFGPAHEAGVKGLQTAAGLKADGIVGPLTWPVLLRVA